MLITDFFDNQEVFITGGSGFIGKGLIEKLLRSCPGISKIFVLLRGKKGKNVDDRLRNMLALPVFNRLKQEMPQAIRKVHVIEGDCGELGLGIKPADLIKLQNVTIIYHSAASVRFDDPLRDAILLNTRGTHELVKIATTLTKLQVFVHVSTTYCNPDKMVVEEMVYPPYADWRSAIELAETCCTEALDILNLKYIGNHPNTYTFTKSLSEQVINDYSNILPVVIFRPSIVISAFEEPVPGWIDNFNGPAGMIVASGLGIVLTNYGDPDVIWDFVAVDFVIRGILVASYKTARETPNTKKQLEVYNCAVAANFPTTVRDFITFGRTSVMKNPYEKAMWMPCATITRCLPWHLLRFITWHILVAILVDLVLTLGNQKPLLFKLQRRIYATKEALSFFSNTTWIFKNEKFFALHSEVPASEVDKFGFLQYSNKDEKFFANAVRGSKTFLLNEPPEASKGARLRFKVFEAITFFWRLIGALLITRFVVRLLYTKCFKV